MIKRFFFDKNACGLIHRLGCIVYHVERKFDFSTVPLVLLSCSYSLIELIKVKIQLRSIQLETNFAISDCTIARRDEHFSMADVILFLRCTL